MKQQLLSAIVVAEFFMGSGHVRASDDMDQTQYTASHLQAEEAKLVKIDAIIHEAKKYLGVPYVWGGETPSGFDCSGFLEYVFTKQSISMSRTVETIWNGTQPVSTLEKGDLVFFETYKKGPSHVGIYLGNNKFIHASSSNGVTISDLNNVYWRSHYLGAKRAF